MKRVTGLFVAAALAGLSIAANAQGLPPGSYQQSCRDFRMQGSTLTAVCPRARGRGDHLTALNVTHCVGDIGNNNGRLVCNGGRPAAPVPPAAYPGPGYAPPPGGSPPPGYAPPPRYSEEQGYREHCEQLRHEERDLRNKLAYTPYGEEREQLQSQLGQVHNEREQCPHR